MKTDFRWAFVGDLQIPYQDDRAVALFLKAMKRWKPDAIDFVGDIDDQLEYSRFSDGTTDEFFNQLKANYKEWEKEYAVALKAHDKADEEEKAHIAFPVQPSRDPLPFVKQNAMGARNFYTTVRKQHPDADLHASLGNHDIRVFQYMDKKAPEYNDELTPNTLWGLDDLGITWKMYHERPHKRFANIHVHHGMTTSSTSGLAVRADIENYHINLVRGHDHKGGVVYNTFPLSGERLVGMGTGHLCSPGTYGLQYTINPEWEQGFGIGHIYDGVAHLQFIPIVDYTCVIDGIVLQG